MFDISFFEVYYLEEQLLRVLNSFVFGRPICCDCYIIDQFFYVLLATLLIWALGFQFRFWLLVYSEQTRDLQLVRHDAR